mmetsp:Transcript_121430/g.220854  ORF Transcript_121430/g.220854 Transcript_121430/m.220854 type:complete len:196 (-) Transcript_121430:77-664(-)
MDIWHCTVGQHWVVKYHVFETKVTKYIEVNRHRGKCVVNECDIDAFDPGNAQPEVMYYLGKTSMTVSELRFIAERWNQSDYDYSTKNCQNFADEVYEKAGFQHSLFGVGRPRPTHEKVKAGLWGALFVPPAAIAGGAIAAGGTAGFIAAYVAVAPPLVLSAVLAPQLWSDAYNNLVSEVPTSQRHTRRGLRNTAT